MSDTMLEGLVYFLPWLRVDAKRGYVTDMKPSRWLQWGYLNDGEVRPERNRWYIIIWLPSYSFRRSMNYENKYTLHQMVVHFTAPLCGEGEWKIDDWPVQEWWK